MNMSLSFAVTKAGELVAWVMDDANGIDIYTLRIPSAIVQVGIDAVTRHLNEQVEIRRTTLKQQQIERQKRIQASAREISITHCGAEVKGWLEPGRAGKELFVVTIRRPSQFAGRRTAQYRNQFCDLSHDNSGNWLPSSLTKAEELLRKLYLKALQEKKHPDAYSIRDQLEAQKDEILTRLRT